jgi:hypothetical protein
MNQKNIIICVVFLAIITVGYFLMPSFFINKEQNLGAVVDPTPKNATITGIYGCLPHLDTSGPQTMECAFGIKTDQGEYYAVNFGQSGEAMEQFKSGAHVTLEGFVVVKEALNTNQWQKYNMKGIFTVTKVLDSNGTGSTNQNLKININVVCENALAYMSFSNGADAEKFVNDCKAGKHPEVIEDYKARMGLGSGVAI